MTLRNGTWDDALAPLAQARGPEYYKEGSEKDPVDVPIMLTPADISQQQLQRVLCAAKRQRGGIESMAKARARERWEKADHMKRLLHRS